jgi:predicted O-methyltransferase YrrM
MRKFDEITRRFERIRYMRAEQAAVMRELIAEADAEAVLEIGFYQGKSSAYIAAILEDRGRGRLLTIDRADARRHRPNIEELLGLAGLAHRVEAVFAHRSFTWELQKLIASRPRPSFDLAYFDGAHTWDGTGFGVLLVDMLLRPGGILVLDDLDWSPETASCYRRSPAKLAAFSADEAATPSVRRVCELVLPHLGYPEVQEIAAVNWAVARKPLG